MILRLTLRLVTVKYKVEISFATIYSYFFDLVWLTKRPKKLLPNLKVVTDLGYSNSYKFDGNNFFFLEFNNVDL